MEIFDPQDFGSRLAFYGLEILPSNFLNEPGTPVASFSYIIGKVSKKEGSDMSKRAAMKVLTAVSPTVTEGVRGLSLQPLENEALRQRLNKVEHELGELPALLLLTSIFRTDSPYGAAYPSGLFSCQRQ
ncbi:hypothetical protein AOC05_10725 [Arthrobacter alpinus]|uniref:Uncharacterized protein n=1 Tax=Arthrobacter alpinus TaxID=656366 RepID=A0A0M4QN38_9MICC|nr:hypothetical protein [Arthrobacter alpinus]ALE92672.1 hypothetical protein AOC05_10725 [Arthrobacter alpinus]